MCMDADDACSRPNVGAILVAPIIGSQSQSGGLLPRRGANNDDDFPRFSRQRCGGSNRNGLVFQNYSNVSGHHRAALLYPCVALRLRSWAGC